METDQSTTYQNPMGADLQRPQARSSSSFSFMAIIISLLLTAVITGSAVYFWQKSASEKTINNLEHKVSSLEEQISTIKKMDSIQNIETDKQQNQESIENEKKITTETVQSESTSKWPLYTNDKVGFSIKYPREWGPIETETYREAISGKGEEFYTLFTNSSLSISGITPDYVQWEGWSPTYKGNDPFSYCKEIEKKVVTIEGCKKIDQNKTSITLGYYSDMVGLTLVRDTFINNFGNKYGGLTISYNFQSIDTGLANMSETQVRQEIENQLKNIDPKIVDTFDNIVSTFDYQ